MAQHEETRAVLRKRIYTLRRMRSDLEILEEKTERYIGKMILGLLTGKTSKWTLGHVSGCFLKRGRSSLPLLDRHISSIEGAFDREIKIDYDLFLFWDKRNFYLVSKMVDINIINIGHYLHPLNYSIQIRHLSSFAERHDLQIKDGRPKLIEVEEMCPEGEEGSWRLED